MLSGGTYLSTMIPRSFLLSTCLFQLEFRLPSLYKYQQECNCLYVDGDIFLVVKNDIVQFPDNLSLIF